MNYVLALNDMREPNIENLQAVQFFTDRQTAVDWHNDQLAPAPWRDGKWGKVFEQGGPLEWFNPGLLEDDAEYYGGLYPVPDHTTAEVALAARWSKA